MDISHVIMNIVDDENYTAISGACRCCLAIGSFNDLWEEYINDGNKVVFGDMLFDCFAIKISKNQISNIKDQICETCMCSLLDANKFRNQVLSVQAQLADPIECEEIKIGNVKEEGVEFIEEYLEEDYLALDEQKPPVKNEEKVLLKTEEPKKVHTVGLKRKHIDSDDETSVNSYEKREQIFLQRFLNVPFKPLPKESILKTDTGPPEKKTYRRSKKNQPNNMIECLESIISGRMTRVQACKYYDCTRRVVLAKLAEFNSKRKISSISLTKTIEGRRPLTGNYRLRKILTRIKRNEINIEQAAEQEEMTVDELKEKLKSKWPQMYNNVMYLEKVRKVINENNSFDESKIQLNGDDEGETRVIKFVKKINKPAKENIIKAIEAIKNGMSYTSASKIFNVSRITLQRFIDQNLEVTEDNIDLVSMKNGGKNVKYSMEMLKQCIKLIQEKRLTMKEAENWFNIPKSVIRYRLDHGFGVTEPTAIHTVRKGVHLVEIASSSSSCREYHFNTEQRLKLEENVKFILNITNATPFLTARRETLCAYCFIPIKKPEELRYHTANEHLDERLDVTRMLRPAVYKEIMRLDLYELKCRHCDLDLKNINELYEHIEIQHDYLIDNKEKNLIVPFVLHHYRFHCAICFHRVGDIARLDLHMNKHYDNYVCDECGESFISLARLKRHKVMKKINNSRYLCEQCDIVFKDPSRYRTHMAKEHKICTSKCGYCTEKFSTRYAKHLHMMEKHRDKVEDIICECGKVFQWKSFYLQHYRRHHVKERNYLCCYCPQKFIDNQNLKRHMNVHVKERAFKCKICHVIFPTNSLLTDHWKSHSSPMLDIFTNN